MSAISINKLANKPKNANGLQIARDGGGLFSMSLPGMSPPRFPRFE
jgi:hypothetical protein